MAPNKQKVVRSGRKLGRPPRPQPATFAPSPVPSPAPKSLKLKVTFKRGETGQPDERDAPAYQFPLSAPPSDDPPVKDDSYGSTATVADSQNRRRGARQRKAPQRDDVVYGSEMDNLIASSATIAQAEDDDNVGMTSSPRKYHLRRSAVEVFTATSRTYTFPPPLTSCLPVEVFRKYD